MVVLLWTLDQKRSPRAGTGVMIPRYSGSIPDFPAFLLDKHNPFIKIEIWKLQLSSKIALAVLPKLKFMMCRLTVITLGSKAS